MTSATEATASQRFVARWVDAGGSQVREEQLEAVSMEALRAELTSRGAQVLTLQAVRPGRQGLLRGESLRWFCREFRALLAAGMTAVEALETLREQAHERAEADLRARVLDQLLRRVQEGASLSTALRSTGAFPEMLIAGVQGAEQSGELLSALDEFLRYHELLTSLRGRVLSAAIYPSMVCAVGLLVVVWLMLFVMPRFASLLQESVQNLPWMVRGLFAFSAWLRMNGLAFGLLALLIAAGIALLWRQGLVGPLLLRLAAGVGPIRRLAQEFRYANTYQTLHLLYRGGYPLDEALRLTALAHQGLRPHREALLNARQRVHEGESISVALHACGLADDTGLRLLKVGERAGDFEGILLTLAQRHAENFGVSIDRLARFVEPLLLFLVSVLVGGLVIMMYLPIFEIAGGLAG